MLRRVLGPEIERHGSADEIVRRRCIDLVAFVDIDGRADIPLETVRKLNHKSELARIRLRGLDAFTGCVSV